MLSELSGDDARKGVGWLADTVLPGNGFQSATDARSVNPIESPRRINRFACFDVALARHLFHGISTLITVTCTHYPRLNSSRETLSRRFVTDRGMDVVLIITIRDRVVALLHSLSIRRGVSDYMDYMQYNRRLPPPTH